MLSGTETVFVTLALDLSKVAPVAPPPPPLVDSVAVIAANTDAIPYFKAAGGLKAVARSMPTSQALDLVGKRLGIRVFEVPTGWKYFGSLMDSHLLGGENMCPLICGEESFGTGSSHIREKDGVWAVLCWLSIIASRNDKTTSKSESSSSSSSPPPPALVTVRDIVVGHWKTFGRNIYCRYDYEGVDKSAAVRMMDSMVALMSDREHLGKIKLDGDGGGEDEEDIRIRTADEFQYKDPINGAVASHQGIRFIFGDGSRFVFRLSGTGSVGATIRLYLERYVGPDVSTDVLIQPVQRALRPLVDAALAVSRLKEFTGRDGPTVIT